MAQHNHEHEIIKECIPVSTNITIEISPASPTIQKTKTKHEIFNNVLTHIQSQIDILLLKEEIEKTNTYCTEFKDDTKRNLNITEFVKEMKMKFYAKEQFYLKKKMTV